RLYCGGIVAVDDGGADSPVGDPGTAAPAGCRGLMVRVEGPGELRVSEGTADTYELRGGRIRRVQPFHLARMVDDWLRGLGAEAARGWSRHRHRLFSAARALGHLSAVDGCVVLDRELNLLGFGGEIRVDNARLQQASRVFAHYSTRRPRPEEELRRFGTRHK